MNPPKIRTPNKKERMKKKKHLGFVKIRKKKKKQNNTYIKLKEKGDILAIRVLKAETLTKEIDGFLV
jgi:uncharacterized protein YuzE